MFLNSVQLLEKKNEIEEDQILNYMSSSMKPLWET